MTFAFAVALWVLGLNETLGFQIVTVGLHRPPTWLGVLVTAQGVGPVCGGLTAGTLAQRRGEGPLACAGIAAFAAAAAAQAVPNAAIVVAGAVLAGVALPWFAVAGTTCFQKHTPPAMMGRVGGAADPATQAPQALGILTGAGLVTAVYYRQICYLSAGILALLALYLANRPEQRT